MSETQTEPAVLERMATARAARGRRGRVAGQPPKPMTKLIAIQRIERILDQLSDERDRKKVLHYFDMEI
jgi:hypothetical protein